MTINFYTPKNIPPDFEMYLTETQQDEIVNSGKLGILRLKLEKDPIMGKTVIRERYCRVPLSIQRAIYLEETLPAMAYLYIMSPSGGILQGDRYRIDITLSNNSLAHITTQGATRIYKMEKNYGAQMINIKSEEGSYLEYIPDQIIPFRNSRFYQEVELSIHDNATIFYSETIVPGRVASGEKFEYDICYIKTIAKNQLGKLRFTDIVKLDPKKEDLTVNGIMGKFDVVSSIYVVTNQSHFKHLLNNINEKIREFEVLGKISGGTSILPAKQGVIVRLLGKTAEDVKKFIFEIARITRNQILGASFSSVRKA